MRLALVLITFTLSLNSYADHFFCTINVNGQIFEDSADYRGRELSVALEGYTCSGKMVDRLVTTTISTDGFGVIAEDEGDFSSQSVFQDYSFKGEPLDLVTCECRLN